VGDGRRTGLRGARLSLQPLWRSKPYLVCERLVRRSWHLSFAINASARSRLTRNGLGRTIGVHASPSPVYLSIHPTPAERSPSHRNRKCCPAAATRGLPAKP